MKTTRESKESLSLRLEPDTRARVERVVEKMAARAGVPVSRSAVLRVILDRGLAALEREHGLAAVAKRGKK